CILSPIISNALTNILYNSYSTSTSSAVIPPLSLHDALPIYFPIPACAPGPSQWPPWTTASASWWTTCSRPCTPHLGSASPPAGRSEEHTSELQSRENLVCRLLLEKKNKKKKHKKICHCDVFI